METPASRAAATGGRPLGTEGLSVLPALVQTSDGASGEAFAAEVARATERMHGGELKQKRIDELEGERRDARRAGFGKPRESEGEAHPVEAVFRREHAPVRAEPASAASPAVGQDPPVEAEAAPSAPGSQTVESRQAAPVESALPFPVTSQPNQPATPASAALPRAAPELQQTASAPAPASEIQPIEPAAPSRPGDRPARAASAPPPPAAPDAAVLERAAEILRQIELHATPHVRRLTLELEPAELGRLSVQLALRTGRVAAIVRGENPETLALLERHESQLLHVLAQRGIAADSVRFELGFGGRRPSRGARTPAPALPAVSRPASLAPSAPPPRDPSRIDLLA